jgi:Uma2 family endonuclease
MSTPAQRKMTVDEFLVWAEGQEGRWELYNGVPYPMGPERVRPGEVLVFFTFSASTYTCRPSRGSVGRQAPA